MARENDILVIECNLRASRSFPFVSKVLKLNLIDLATKVMLGLPVEKPSKNLFDLDYVGIKASQFSFNRLQKADPVLGVDMASTGEVGCIGDNTDTALLKAMLSVGHRIPKKTVLLSTGSAKQKAEMLDAAKQLVDNGYELYATGGTSKYLTDNGIENTLVHWPSENAQPQALDLLHEHKIDMVVNIPKNLTTHELTNGYKIRRAAIDLNVPLITNSRLASAFIHAFCSIKLNEIGIKSCNNLVISNYCTIFAKSYSTFYEVLLTKVMDVADTLESKINRSEYKILIVDDVVSNVLLLKILLTNEKFQVCTANNGTTCIEQAKKEHPDLILLDVMMPDISGFDTAVVLKKDEETKEIPIIFLTALNTPQDLVHGFQVGASDFLTKPFNKEELVMRVMQQISLTVTRCTRL